MNSVWITDDDGIERLVNVGSDAHKEYELQERITQKINQKISNNLTNKQMKKAKITHIQGNGTWNDLYKFDVTMDNNDTGTVFSKSQTPPFAVGDEKSYEITPSGRGHKIKWIQEQRTFTPSGSGSSSYHKSPQDKVEIARAVALKAAVDAIGEGENPAKYVNYALYFEHYLTTGQQANQDAVDNALNDRKMDHRTGIVENFREEEIKGIGDDLPF